MVQEEGKLPNDLLVARRLDARRHYVQNNLAYDPVFEFSDNKMLHERQVAISDFQQLKEETADSGVKQIMGAGKTTVVSPLSMTEIDGRVWRCHQSFVEDGGLLQKRVCLFRCDRSEDEDNIAMAG